jgi:hypothetical protein
VKEGAAEIVEGGTEDEQDKLAEVGLGNAEREAGRVCDGKGRTVEETGRSKSQAVDSQLLEEAQPKGKGHAGAEGHGVVSTGRGCC